MILLGLGVALVAIGATVLADEWRRSGLQRSVVEGLDLRLEWVAGTAAIIGLGVAVAYAGVSA
jgi:hypothetical protein